MTDELPSRLTVAASSIAAPGSEGNREVDRFGTDFSVARSSCVRLRTSDAGADAAISYWWTIGNGCPVWWI